MTRLGAFNRLSPLGRVLGTVALLVFLAEGAVSGQAIKGEVVDAQSGDPVVGALLTAVDQGGRPGSQALTDETGNFTLDLQRGFNPVRVRVERIGYATQSFDAAELSGESGVILRVTSQPILLEGIQAVTESLCGDDVRGTGPVQDLWEEAGKSLRITEVSQNHRVLRFETESFERTLSPGDRAVVDGTSRRRRFFAEKPYRSIPIEQMTSRGWIEETEDGDLIYYAPDASVLLSEEFTQQHCFSAERTDEAILLRFEPNRRRSDIPEIEGVMHLDPQTKELTELRFSYVSLPLPRGTEHEAGGEVHFYGAPNGLRVVREWAIRIPAVGLIRSRFRGGYSEGVQIRHIREVGGRITRIRVGDAYVEVAAARRSDPVEETSSSTRPGLRKWTEDVEGRTGVALHLRNDLHIPIRVTSLELWDCRNVAIRCSSHDVGIVVTPGQSERLLVVPRDDRQSPMEFQWHYAAMDFEQGREDRSAALEDPEMPIPRVDPDTTTDHQLPEPSVSVVTYLTVRDAETREIVPDVSFRLDGGAWRTTAARGRVHVGRLLPGPYHLELRHGSFGVWSDTLVVPDASAHHWMVELAPGVIELEGLTVTVDAVSEAEQSLRSLGIDPALLGGRWITLDDIEAIGIKRDIGAILERQGIGSMRVIRPENLVPGSENTGLCVSLARARTGAGVNRCALIVVDGRRKDPIQALYLDPEAMAAAAVLQPTEAAVAFGIAGEAGAVMFWTRKGNR